MNILIILLAGRKGSGKSTVAEMLKRLTPNSIELTLAAPLKSVCQTLFNLSDDQLYDQNKKEEIDDRWGVSPRILFQRVGDLFRDDLKTRLPELKMMHNIFIENILMNIEMLRRQKNPPDMIIISDVRMLDEYEVLQKLPGAVSIKLIRNGTTLDTHQSEKIPFECSHTILNNGGLNELENEISRAIRGFAAALPTTPAY